MRKLGKVRKDSKPYTPTSHTSTNTSQEAQRKAGGPRYLGGLQGCGGLDRRRNTDSLLQLSHKATAVRQQPAKAVCVRRGEKEKRMRGRTGGEEDKVNMELWMMKMQCSA